MITQTTVDQLLEVLRLFRENYERGSGIEAAYQAAVRAVADKYSVTYQNIGDGCRRRLRLNDIHEFFGLLAEWMRDNPAKLANQLKSNAVSATHRQITDFFVMFPAVSERSPREGSGVMVEAETESFSVRLPKRISRMLRALSELKGKPAAEMIKDIIATEVEERMKPLQHEI
ncbi:MAG: hypothetical protein HZA91_05895 [Verrucomicrobia bacterium]|nr:hypothetical protein [Verrucomicrobiota bacterium]